jgi:hypothetical protein
MAGIEDEEWANPRVIGAHAHIEVQTRLNYQSL